MVSPALALYAMGPRCASASHVFLPFLYPSLFLANTRVASRLSAPFGFASSRCYNSTSSETNLDDPEARTRLNPSPDDYAETAFADKATLSLFPGDGGSGCISFLREAYVSDGPANGGDGGHGGNIYIQAVHGETSLHKLARKRLIRADRGKTGRGSSQAGPRGEDVVITVPVGTVLRELSRQDPERDFVPSKPSRDSADAGDEPFNPEAEKWVLYPGISSSERSKIELPKTPKRERLYRQPPAPINLDLSRPTPRPILLAAGGIGGLGNPHFVSKQRPKPMFATKGEKAMSMQIELELKLLADVGLVGLPNAGKSTLLRALTNSRARVGNWAFTTLQPNIGTVVLDDNRGRPVVTSFRRTTVSAADGNFAPASDSEDTQLERRTRFTVADIPGLIEGAHLDKGLGIAFLRHVERAGVLAFVVDLGAGNAVKALNALWNEVGLYAQMREEEEKDRDRESRIDWHGDAKSPPKQKGWSKAMMADYPLPETNATGLHIAAKPWFVVATKGDLPDTQQNFEELREYLAAIARGDIPHPSGVEGAWTANCTVIPVSAIHGHGVDRIVHWTVGLLDG